MATASKRLAAAEAALDNLRASGDWDAALKLAKTWKAAFVSSSSTSPAHPTPSLVEAYRLTVQGEVAAAKRKVDDARRYYVRALQQCGTYVDALVLLAELDVHTGAWPGPHHLLLSPPPPTPTTAAAAAAAADGAGPPRRKGHAKRRSRGLRLPGIGIAAFRRRDAADSSGGAAGSSLPLGAQALAAVAAATAAAARSGTPTAAPSLSQGGGVSSSDAAALAPAGAGGAAGTGATSGTANPPPPPPLVVGPPVSPASASASASASGLPFSDADALDLLVRAADGALAGIAFVSTHRLHVRVRGLALLAALHEQGYAYPQKNEARAPAGPGAAGIVWSPLGSSLLASLAATDLIWRVLHAYVRERYGATAGLTTPPALLAPSAPAPAPTASCAFRGGLVLVSVSRAEPASDGPDDEGAAQHERGQSYHRVSATTAFLSTLDAAGSDAAASTASAAVTSRALGGDAPPDVFLAAFPRASHAARGMGPRMPAPGGGGGGGGAAAAAALAASSGGALLGAGAGAPVLSLLRRLDPRTRDEAAAALMRIPLLLHGLGDIVSARKAYAACLDAAPSLAASLPPGSAAAVIGGLLSLLCEGASAGLVRAGMSTASTTPPTQPTLLPAYTWQWPRRPRACAAADLCGPLPGSATSRGDGRPPSAASAAGGPGGVLRLVAPPPTVPLLPHPYALLPSHALGHISRIFAAASVFSDIPVALALGALRLEPATDGAGGGGLFTAAAAGGGTAHATTPASAAPSSSLSLAALVASVRAPTTESLWGRVASHAVGAIHAARAVLTAAPRNEQAWRALAFALAAQLLTLDPAASRATLDASGLGVVATGGAAGGRGISTGALSSSTGVGGSTGDLTLRGDGGGGGARMESLAWAPDRTASFLAPGAYPSLVGSSALPSHRAAAVASALLAALAEALAPETGQTAAAASAAPARSSKPGRNAAKGHLAGANRASSAAALAAADGDGADGSVDADGGPHSSSSSSSSSDSSSSTSGASDSEPDDETAAKTAAASNDASPSGAAGAGPSSSASPFLPDSCLLLWASRALLVKAANPGAAATLAARGLVACEREAAQPPSEAAADARHLLVRAAHDAVLSGLAPTASAGASLRPLTVSEALAAAALARKRAVAGAHHLLGVTLLASARAVSAADSTGGAAGGPFFGGASAAAGADPASGADALLQRAAAAFRRCLSVTVAEDAGGDGGSGAPKSSSSAGLSLADALSGPGSTPPRSPELAAEAATGLTIDDDEEAANDNDEGLLEGEDDDNVEEEEDDDEEEEEDAVAAANEVDETLGDDDGGGSGSAAGFADVSAGEDAGSSAAGDDFDLPSPAEMEAEEVDDDFGGETEEEAEEDEDYDGGSGVGGVRPHGAGPTLSSSSTPSPAADSAALRLLLAPPSGPLPPRAWLPAYHLAVTLLALGRSADAALCAGTAIGLASSRAQQLTREALAVILPGAPATSHRAAEVASAAEAEALGAALLPSLALPWAAAVAATAATQGTTPAATVLCGALAAFPNDVLLRYMEACLAERLVAETLADGGGAGQVDDDGWAEEGGEGAEGRQTVSSPAPSALLRGSLADGPAEVLAAYQQVAVVADALAWRHLAATANGSDGVLHGPSPPPVSRSSSTGEGGTPNPLPAPSVSAPEGSGAQMGALSSSSFVLQPSMDIGVPGARARPAPPPPSSVRLAVAAHLSVLRVAAAAGKYALAHAALAAADALVDACGSPLRLSVGVDGGLGLGGTAGGSVGGGIRGLTSPSPTPAAAASSSAVSTPTSGSTPLSWTSPPSPFDAAFPAARQAVPADPVLRADVLHAAGLLHEAAGAVPAAEAHYGAAVALAPSHVPSLVRLADIALTSALAIAHGTEDVGAVAALARGPVSAPIPAVIARRHAALGASAEAVERDAMDTAARAAALVASALRVDPRGCPEAWSVLARVRAATGRHGAAAAASLRALERSGKRPLVPPSLLPWCVPLWA
jgi:hypothetical protein